MYHRLQIFYAIIAVLAAISLVGMFFLNYYPDWVSFPEENGNPSYGVWKACAEFPDELYAANCRRWWDERWVAEAKLVHTPARAAASFFIFGMFFNIILFVFVVLVVIFASKVDFYPGVPITLASITVLMYLIACLIMELCVKRRLIFHSTNHSNLPRNAPRENGLAAVGAWTSFACSIVNMFLGVLVLVFKPTKAEVMEQFQRENFSMA